MMKNGTTVLLTNDDGINARGLMALEAALRGPAGRKAGIGRVVTVSTAFPCSGGSRSVSIFSPLRCAKVGEDRYEMDGTPTDCVTWGLKWLLKEKADFVVSGINHGPNVGTDIVYSGTVSAALDAARAGVPAAAFSLAAERDFDFSFAARFAVKAVAKVLKEPPPPGVALSFNIPSGRPRGVRVTIPGGQLFSDRILRRVDPFGREYFWLAAGKRVRKKEPVSTDVGAIRAGFISLTPLDSNLHAEYANLSSWSPIF